MHDAQLRALCTNSTIGNRTATYEVEQVLRNTLWLCEHAISYFRFPQRNYRLVRVSHAWHDVVHHPRKRKPGYNPTIFQDAAACATDAARHERIHTNIRQLLIWTTDGTVLGVVSSTLVVSVVDKAKMQ